MHEHVGHILFQPEHSIFQTKLNEVGDMFAKESKHCTIIIYTVAGIVLKWRRLCHEMMLLFVQPLLPPKNCFTVFGSVGKYQKATYWF
jgi:hypothetical protein